MWVRDQTSKVNTSSHLAAGCEESFFFSFHVSGARPWCQCTPAVNQGLIYAWQQLWMLNEDPLHVHAHIYTQQHTLLAYCQRLFWLWSESEVTWLQTRSSFFPLLTLQGGKQHLTAQRSRLQHNAEPEQTKNPMRLQDKEESGWMESFIPAAVNGVYVTVAMWVGTPIHWFHHRASNLDKTRVTLKCILLL